MEYIVTISLTVTEVLYRIDVDEVVQVLFCLGGWEDLGYGKSV
ncbi:Uncharacterised protein [Arcanobacterium haemolyticum]|uniref:Uncharacterized protein n=1 Tax=Arcanobacterium haemolyticum (strain ATCC 9345 / DSM 20595 / CCM 5947 / CCUG 17215 / LMG 16163 / NBRC 15585 / NCTC 8452 / 11018) TaxID=644284 RepID=D7BNL1_ARCHD|nr:hypothetical protein Arch_0778 [Arcanobacterium haemolyticum DSM 20595]SQH28760.1 Uncharacterised protein [Arcanobacterium haemolyticum]